MNRLGNHAVRELAREAAANGWTCVKTNGGHVRFRYRDGTPVFCASTPSDVRAFRNIRAQMRRVERASA